MKSKAIKLVMAIVLVLICSLGLMILPVLMGSGDYSIPLPNGYHLVRTYSNHVVMSKPPVDEGVLGAPIESYAVSGQIVIGCVGSAEGYGYPQEEQPGYFIVDTKTGQVRKGLNSKEWKSILSSLGLRKIPNLMSPNRTQAWLSHFGVK